jgi:5'-3' exonuclease
MSNLNKPHMILVDLNNIAMVKYHGIRRNNESTDVLIPMTLRAIINELKKLFKKLNGDKLVLAVDSQNTWRKQLKTLRGYVYKGDRADKYTESEKLVMKDFFQQLSDLVEVFDNHTGITVLKAESLEADDLIAQCVNSKSDEYNITICSGDEDFIQLLDNINVRQYNPRSGLYITLEDYDNDVEWHKFFKFIRANEDNIKSAYPRVRETKLKRAYNDSYEMVNLMEHKWTDHEGNEWKVGDLYEENKKLMDLTEQPAPIKLIMEETVEHAFEKHTVFNDFYFGKFCHKYGLPIIFRNLREYEEILKG